MTQARNRRQERPTRRSRAPSADLLPLNAATRRWCAGTAVVTIFITMLTTPKSRALSQLTDYWWVATSIQIGNRLAFVTVRGEQGSYTPHDGLFVVSPWRWNDAYRQYVAACDLCTQRNDMLLENAPVDGPDAVESLMADIQQSEEFAKMALARRSHSDFVAHKEFADLCRRRLANAKQTSSGDGS
jgi:hypothetical protein